MKGVDVTREEAIEALQFLINFANENGIAELMVNKNKKRVEEIAEKMSKTNEWLVIISYLRCDDFDLVDELSNEYALEIAFIMWKSGYGDDEFWEDTEVFEEMLIALKKPIALYLVDIMRIWNLFELSTEKFLNM